MDCWKTNIPTFIIKKLWPPTNRRPHYCCIITVFKWSFLVSGLEESNNLNVHSKSLFFSVFNFLHSKALRSSLRDFRCTWSKDKQNKNISQLWYEFGQVHKKYDFLKKIHFSCHNCTFLFQNIYQIVQFFDAMRTHRIWTHRMNDLVESKLVELRTRQTNELIEVQLVKLRMHRILT